MIRIKDIIQYLESIAPPSYQESYDNSGLITGNSDSEVEGVLITLDTTEAVIEEAIENNCNLIISHHPIIFSGLKRLTGSNYVERTIIKAIENKIAIYAIHTNLDNVAEGVNKKIVEKIGLINTHILRPKSQVLSKLVTFAPTTNAKELKQALFNAGAGNIGNYSECSFEVIGEGQFTPNTQSNPTIGSKNNQERVKESRIELIFPAHLSSQIIDKLKDAHPYEEVAYYLTTLENQNQETGAGMVGELKNEMDEDEFLQTLKQKMALNMIRHTPFTGRKVKKVAVCGGTGSFLLKDAIRAQADVFITADFKYHEFFDAEGKLIIADIGHYESEVYTKELLYELLTKNFTTFALNLSKIVTNPLSYL